MSNGNGNGKLTREQQEQLRIQNQNLLNLSGRIPVASTRTFAVPYYNKETRKMDIQEFDPIEALKKNMIDTNYSSEENKIMAGILSGAYGGVDYGGIKHFQRLSPDKQNKALQQGAIQYIKGRGGSFGPQEGQNIGYGQYSNYGNLSDEEKQNKLHETRAGILRGLGDLTGHYRGLRWKKIGGGSSVRGAGREMLVNVKENLGKIGLDKNFSKRLKTFLGQGSISKADGLIEFLNKQIGPTALGKLVSKTPMLQTYINLSRNAQEIKE